MTPKEQRKFFEREIKPYVDKKLKEQAKEIFEDIEKELIKINQDYGTELYRNGRKMYMKTLEFPKVINCIIELKQKHTRKK